MRKGSRSKPRNVESPGDSDETGFSHNSDDDALEAGIASIFAAIQETGFTDADDAEVDIEQMDNFLFELNRLWASPQPG